MVFGVRRERDSLGRFRERRMSGTVSVGFKKRKMFEVVERLVS